MIHRQLDNLEMPFRLLARDFIDALNNEMQLPKNVFAENGVKGFIILETLRELPVQMAYYTRGRMPIADVQKYFVKAGLWRLSSLEAMAVSTWTLDSKHIDGLAIDIAPSSSEIAPWWAAPESVWDRMAEIAEACGLVAGRRWKDNKDSPHFQSA